MDLVEIRKKAKKKTAAREVEKTSGVGIQEPPVKSTASIAPASVPETGADEGEEKPPVGKPPQKTKTHVPFNTPDALAELFDQAPELELATEESYLQGLEGRDLEAEADLQQWLTFVLGAEHYALDIRYVKEIIKPRDITDIPRVPGFILGIISLRGIIVPIYDLRQRLNLGNCEVGEHTRIIVCEDGERTAGLLVDSLTQVVKLPAGEIEPPPGILSGLDRDFIEGVGRHHGQMIILLDLSNVLDTGLN